MKCSSSWCLVITAASTFQITWEPNSLVPPHQGVSFVTVFSLFVQHTYSLLPTCFARLQNLLLTFSSVLQFFSTVLASPNSSIPPACDHYGSLLLSRETHPPLPSPGIGFWCSSYKSFKWDMSQSWQLLCKGADVAVITKQIFSSLKSLPAFHRFFRIAMELFKACAIRKDWQCWCLVLSTISGSLVMHCLD